MQAKDLDEGAIVALLLERPGEWHTYPPGHGMLVVFDPTHPDAPENVLRAKLRSMVRRGIIGGCPCGCRGDFHAPPMVYP